MNRYQTQPTHAAVYMGCKNLQTDATHAAPAVPSNCYLMDSCSHQEYTPAGCRAGD